VSVSNREEHADDDQRGVDHGISHFDRGRQNHRIAGRGCASVVFPQRRTMFIDIDDRVVHDLAEAIARPPSVIVLSDTPK